MWIQISEEGEKLKLRPIASGIKPKTAVVAVNKTGLKRERPASTMQVTN